MDDVFSGKRILLAEDDGILAIMLSDALKDMGFGAVDVAHSLASALTTVRDRKPDVALLDVHLTDGISVRVAEVLALSGIPSVFISGDYDAASTFGVDPSLLLQKPFAPVDLQQALQKALAKVPTHA